MTDGRPASSAPDPPALGGRPGEAIACDAVAADAVAADGSPVEVYRRLPPGPEAELIHRAVPPGAPILELGAGAGRVTRGLVGLGHPVVAVDESVEMLADVATIAGAEPVAARIEELRLGRTFPAVVLGSHFVNAPAATARTFLEACRRHVDADGAVLVESYPESMRWQAGRPGRAGDVEIVLERVERRGRAGRIIDATVRYAVDGRAWRQSFSADLLDEAALGRRLRPARLRFERWLDRERGWLLARPLSARGADG